MVAHVPELRGSGWAESATLRDLLANRSGLPLLAGLEFGFAGRKDEDDGALSRLAADIAAAVPTSSFWSYTNVGWCLLGRVIETATGTAWEDAIRLGLAADAGMRQTTFATDPLGNRRAAGHAVTADGPVPVEPLIARAYGPAGTSVVSTVTDLLRFAALHLEDSPLAACVRCMRRSRSTAGSIPGVSAGPGSTGAAVRCGGGTASSPASGQFCDSCRSIRLPSS